VSSPAESSASPPPMAPMPRTATVGLLTLAYLMVLYALTWAIVLKTESAYFLIFGGAACFIVTLPMLNRRYDLMSPWSLLALMVYIGCGVRSVFIAFGIDGSRTVDQLFLLGRRPGFFVWPSLLYLSALGLMAIGYSSLRRRPDRRRVDVEPFDFAPWLHLVVAACAIIGGLAFILYAQQTGGLSLTRLSEKRTTITGLQLSSDYASYGGLKMVNRLSAFAFWILLASFAQRGVRHSMFSARGCALAILFVNATLLPIYSSNRAEVAFILIIAGAIELCLGESRYKRRRVVVRGGLVILAILTLLTALRASAQTDQAEALGRNSVAMAIGDAVVFNRNFSDIATTSHIIHAVPKVLPLQYGQTILAWAAAPIPRSVWPGKPLISSGPIIGIKVFGNERAGVPPGFVGEMFWNFHVPGVLVGSFLLGLILRLLYERQLDRTASPKAVLMYCIVVFRLGADAMTVGVGYALFNAALSAVLVYVLLVLVKRPTKGPSVRGTLSDTWRFHAFFTTHTLDTLTADTRRRHTARIPPPVP